MQYWTLRQKLIALTIAFATITAVLATSSHLLGIRIQETGGNASLYFIHWLMQALTAVGGAGTFASIVFTEYKTGNSG